MRGTVCEVMQDGETVRYYAPAKQMCDERLANVCLVNDCLAKCASERRMSELL